MIARSEMFTPLLEADPTFEPRWRGFIAEYADEPELPLYIALGELAKHLIEQQRRGEGSARRAWPLTFRVTRFRKPTTTASPIACTDPLFLGK
jgi:hypothetical protein